MRIGLLLPPGFAILSFAPLAAFEAANMVIGKNHYDVHVVSSKGGPLPNSFGMTVKTERASEIELDTLLIGSTPDTLKPPTHLTEYLSKVPKKVRRIASICIGAFVMGEAGLLDGRRSTTHWMFGKELQERFPKTTVEIDRIFITDGQIWTSAGMTAGIDMALGLIERDLGPDIVRDAARTMVVHHRRAGGQSQYSALLEIDGKSDRVQLTLDHARRNLAKDLSIERLSKIACLSARQFARVFKDETGMTPAKAVENLRLEKARYLLQQSRLPIEAIALDAGFGDRERMRRSFQRTFGQTPQSMRNAAPPLASA